MFEPFTESELALFGSDSESLPLRILNTDDPDDAEFLRKKSLPLDCRDPNLPALIARMIATLQSITEIKAVGLAAPQIGINRRVFVLKHSVDGIESFSHYINPTIRSTSDDTIIKYECCLSMSVGFGRVERRAAIDVSYLTCEGKEIQQTLTDLASRAFQHEREHLDGILFTDKLYDVKLIPNKIFYKMRDEGLL